MGPELAGSLPSGVFFLPSITFYLCSARFSSGPFPDPSASFPGSLHFLLSSVHFHPLFHLSPSLHQDPPPLLVLKLELVQNAGCWFIPERPICIYWRLSVLTASLSCTSFAGALMHPLHAPQMPLHALHPENWSPPSTIPTDRGTE